MSANYIEVQIFGQVLRLHCPPEQQQHLLSSAERLEERVAVLKEQSGIIQLEKVLAIVALNLNYELELEKQKNEIIKSAYEEAEKMMNEMRAKASALVEKIQHEEKNKEDAKQIQKNLNMLSTALREEKNKTVEVVKKIKTKVNFKVGDRVFVKSINQKIC